MKLGKPIHFAYMIGCYAAGCEWMISRYLLPPDPFFPPPKPFEWITILYAPIFAPFYAFMFLPGLLLGAVAERRLSEALPESITVLVFLAAARLSYNHMPRQRVSSWISASLFAVAGAGVLWIVVLFALARAIGPAGAN